MFTRLAVPNDSLELAHLKQVSRIKHHILEKYLPPWALILGARYKKLCYVDCFAGPGRYESGGLEVPGSPVIAVNAAKEFALQHRHHSLVLVLIENNRDQVNLLKNHLTPFEP